MPNLSDVFTTLLVNQPLSQEERLWLLDHLEPWTVDKDDIVQVIPACEDQRLVGLLIVVEESDGLTVHGYQIEYDGDRVETTRIAIPRNSVTKTGGQIKWTPSKLWPDLEADQREMRSRALAIFRSLPRFQDAA